ncbi:MAG: hypothetical protein HY690_02450 [Chloroflexi bacterium]|nr:hypothetical protein [Chloroflexota bacterium]
MSTTVNSGSDGKTRLALLGTLGHLHTEGLRYDLACLRSLVERLEPDLLGVEIDPQAWEQQDLSGVSVEVREGLVPAAWRTNTVIVPLGGPSPLELAPPTGSGLARRARAGLVGAADRFLAGLQRTVDGPEGVNSALFGHLCGAVCDLQAAAGGEVGRRAWEATNGRILERLLWAVRRDPGRRVLVALQCRRVHWLEARLRSLREEIALVRFQEL